MILFLNEDIDLLMMILCFFDNHTIFALQTKH